MRWEGEGQGGGRDEVVGERVMVKYDEWQVKRKGR